MVLQVLDVVNETRVEVACPTRSGRSLPVPHSSALPAHSRAVLGASADEGEGQQGPHQVQDTQAILVFKAAALSPGTSGHPVTLAGIPIGGGHPEVLDWI